MKKRKLILILIDGVGADYFPRHRSFMPHIDQLATNGFSVGRLGAPMPATSLPGRVSMITGVETDRHGVYGNRVFDSGGFRYANPDDVCAPSVATQAKTAGLHVASAGYAMVKTEDIHTNIPPWWVNEWVQKSRDPDPEQLDAGWKKINQVKDEFGLIATLEDTVVIPDRKPSAPWNHSQVGGLARDQEIMRWTTALACHEQAPDLILTEINMTDEVQHAEGFASDRAHWVMSAADTMVGNLVTALHRKNLEDKFVIAVTSDHGHSEITTAIFPDNVIPEFVWGSEGSVLHVFVDNQKEASLITDKLAPFGVTPWNSDHIPEARRSNIATFIAPARVAFEPTPTDLPKGQATGAAHYISSHGMHPDSPDDDRFCVFYGAGIEQGHQFTADANQLAPTLASVLGLDTDVYPAKPFLS